MRPHLALFALVAGLLAPPVAGQPYDGTFYLPQTHRDDLTAVPLTEALCLVLYAEIGNDNARSALARAGASGDSALRPQLFQIADAYAESNYKGFSRQALRAMLWLGEPTETFLDLAVREAERRPDLASFALETAAIRPDSGGIARIEPLRSQPGSVGSGVSTYGWLLRHAQAFHLLPVERQIEQLAERVVRTFIVFSDEGPYPSISIGADVGELGALEGWGVDQLAQLGRTHPALVQDAIIRQVDLRTQGHAESRTGALMALRRLTHL